MIEEQNPWWISKELILENEIYRRWYEAEVKWVPDVLDKISLEPFSLNLIFGPRQVGKSTALVLLVKRLLEKEDPKSIFYFSCDMLSDYKELDQVLGEYMKLRERNRIKSAYVILDEVTFPREWFRTIKYRIDRGEFRNDVLVLSGSLSMRAKGEVESFPGRRGKGRTLIMYPLSFSRFVEVMGVKLPRGDLDHASNAMDFVEYRSTVKNLFEIYLDTGGFPNSVRDYLRTGKVNMNTFQDFISSITLDLNKLRRSETLFKAAVKGVINRTSSEFSYHTLSKEGIGTVRTTISYLELMDKLFLLKSVMAMDPNSGEPVPRKERKFYFIDPFVYRAFSSWVMTQVPDQKRLAEAAVVSHLSRIYPTFYIKRNGEVDVVVREGERYKGFEVKYGKNVRKFIGKVKDIVFLSREEIQDNMVPISLFLALLDLPQSVEVTEV
ncbi:ATP-binding protein [Metallosphaera hakonensis]|uniref:DUF4143 domain-containing protein n=1 Tax=Metallosphaera hakonensis JCM 8857 = DSM 7519 TaxID=1293036 RepID=A0A2U9IRK5_9CREN|nr:ATP-binding protein [Metallosphaera hakonensis]AWR98613.1 AAA family ATPase [Metallosphaera hakonensis JCM 8857 = DSM 7519]